MCIGWNNKRLDNVKMHGTTVKKMWKKKKRKEKRKKRTDLII